MSKSNIEYAVEVLVAALQSGKLPSYEPHNVAEFFKVIHSQICSSYNMESNSGEQSPILR